MNDQKTKSHLTGMNSAYRKKVQQRQEFRRFAVIGVAAGIIFLLLIFFSNRSDDTTSHGPQPGDTGLIEQAAEHPLVMYARGTRSAAELDALMESSSGD